MVSKRCIKNYVFFSNFISQHLVTMANLHFLVHQFKICCLLTPNLINLFEENKNSSHSRPKSIFHGYPSAQVLMVFNSFFIFSHLNYISHGLVIAAFCSFTTGAAYWALYSMYNYTKLYISVHSAMALYIKFLKQSWSARSFAAQRW